MTLEEAISQLVSLGQKDPLTIARKVIEKNDKHWLAVELTSLAEDVIAEMARKLLGSQRRSSERALTPGGGPMASAELKLRSFWVPEVGYKKAADLTSGDLRARASWYDQMSVAALRRASWCREVADMVDAEGVETLGKLRKDLPALPEEGDIEPPMLDAA